MIPFVISSSWVFSLMAMHWVDNFFSPESASARNCSRIYSLILVVKPRKLGWRSRNKKE
jgi:hypothetical protein